MDNQVSLGHIDFAGGLIGGSLAQIAAMKGFALAAALVILALVSPELSQLSRFVTGGTT